MKRINHKARLCALKYLWSWAREGSCKDSDFIIDREDYTEVSDDDLSYEMKRIERQLYKEINKTHLIVS